MHGMAQSNDLLAMVREKQEQIAKLQAELDEVRQLLNSNPKPPAPRPTVRRIFPNDHYLPGIATGPRRTARRRKRPESSVALATVVVEDHGAPLHVDEMIRRIHTQYGKHVEKQTLVSNLSRLAKAGEGWERTAPNTFGLKKKSN